MNSGKGSIRADGSHYDRHKTPLMTTCLGASGSGGRIDVMTTDDSLFEGNIAAVTGFGSQFSGAGTVIRRSIGWLMTM